MAWRIVILRLRPSLLSGGGGSVTASFLMVLLGSDFKVSAGRAYASYSSTLLLDVSAMSVDVTGTSIYALLG